MGNKAKEQAKATIKIGARYSSKVLFEQSISVNGWGGLVIYGEHANGYFCCIPGEYGVEMAEPSDTFYNSEKLMRAGAPELLANGLAKAIKYLGEKMEIGREKTPSEEAATLEKKFAAIFGECE